MNKIQTTPTEQSVPIISDEVLKALEEQEQMRIVNAAQDYVDGVFYYGQLFGSEKFLVTSKREFLTFEQAKAKKIMLRKEAARGGRLSSEAVKGFITRQLTVDPKALFTRLVRHIKRFVRLGDDAEYSFLALWVMGTYVFRALPAFPYVHVTGEKGSGKTTLLDLLAEVCFNGVFSSSSTPAVIYNDVDVFSSTLFIDEAEHLGGGQKDAHAAALLKVLKAGYKRGATVRRMGGENYGDTKEYWAYSPKVIGGISGIDNVLQDRTIAIRMVRKSPAEKAEHYTGNSQIKSLEGALRDDHYIFALTHGVALADRFNNHRGEIRGLEGLENRPNELWAPIMLIAELVGGESRWLTSEMHDLALRRAEEQVQDDQQNNETSALLSGLVSMWKKVKPAREVDGVGLFPVDSVCKYLRSQKDLEWLSSPKKLTPRLRTLGINQTSQRVDHDRDTTRCYKISAELLREVCGRYGVQFGGGSVTESVTGE